MATLCLSVLLSYKVVLDTSIVQQGMSMNVNLNKVQWHLRHALWKLIEGVSCFTVSVVSALCGSCMFVL